MSLTKTCDSIFNINKEYMAIILMTVGSIMTTTAYVYANEGKYHPFTTVTIRGVVAMGIMYLLSLRQKQDLTFASKHNFKWILIISATNLLMALVYAWCQFYLPQPIAVALNSSTPIFMALFDKILYGVSMSKPQVTWLMVTFFGVLLVANGNQITTIFHDKSHEGSSSFQNYLSSDPTVMLCVSIILLIVRGIYSYGVMLIKKLKDSTSLEIMYFQNMVLLFATAILLPVGLKDENFYKPEAMDLLQLALFTCIPLSLGQLAVNQALLMTKNYGLVTPFMFSSIIAGYIISIVRYGEEANVICLAGNVGIIVGVTLLLRSKAD